MSGRGLWLILAVIAGAALFLVLYGDEGIGGLDGGNVVTLVLACTWGGVLASGLLLASRGRWGRTFAAAAFWIVAFVVVIAAYAYQTELRGVGNRLLAVVSPGRVVSMDASGTEIMVSQQRDGHFHLDARMNGIEVPLLVDTGASVVAIDPPVAKRIGIPLEDLRYSASIRTANGVARAAPVRIDSIEIGGILRRNVAAVVTQSPGIGVGLLGMSFLGTLSSLEFRGDQLILKD